MKNNLFRIVLVFFLIFSLAITPAFAASSLQSTYINAGGGAISKTGGSSMTATSFGDVAARITSTSFILEAGYVPTTLASTSLTDDSTGGTGGSGSSAGVSPSVSSFAAISVAESLTKIIKDPEEFRSHIILAKTEPLVLELNLQTGYKPIKRLAIFINEKPEIGNPYKGGSYFIYDRHGQFERSMCLQGENPLHYMDGTVYYCNRAGLFDKVQFELTETTKEFNGKVSIYFTETFEEYNIDIYAYDNNLQGINRAGLPLLNLTVLDEKDFIEFVGSDIPEDDIVESEIIYVKEKRAPIPDWIKQRSKAWAADSSSDVGFAQGIQEMISREILHTSQEKLTILDENSENVIIPQWVKNNAKWFADDVISEDEYVDAIQFLIYNDHLRI